MDIQAILTLSLAILVLAWKPGAGFFLTMFITLRQGMMAALIFVFGAAIGDALYFLIAYYGIAVGAAYFDFLVILIKSLGAVYLVWYGIKGLHTDIHAKEVESLPTKKQALQDFATGIIFTLSNPLAIIFYMALLPTIIDLRTLTSIDVTIATAVVVIAGTASYMTLSLTAHFLGRSFIKNEHIMGRLNTLMSLAIILIGLLIGWSTLPLIDVESLFF